MRRKKHAAIWSCLDCGKDIFKSGEYYMLHDALWKSINPKDRGMLCLACAEKRLGRELEPPDFTDAPVNAIHSLVCNDLMIRVYGERPPAEWVPAALELARANGYLRATTQ